MFKRELRETLLVHLDGGVEKAFSVLLAPSKGQSREQEGQSHVGKAYN